MIKFIVFICLSVISINYASAQDKIIRKNGKSIDCEILSIDSSKIELKTLFSGQYIITFINLTDISAYIYNGITYYVNKSVNPWETSDKNSAGINIEDSMENLNQNFIYTYSGEILYGTSIDYKKPFFGSSYFIIDSRKIEMKDVKFYKNETGFFANTQDLNSMGIPGFAKRITKGRINLYQEEKTNYNTGYYNPTTGMYSGGMMTISLYDYYNNGFGDLKKADYKNLSHELADNPESLICLEKYKKINNTITILGITGGVMMVGGLVTLINRTKGQNGSGETPEPDAIVSLGAMIVGAGCFWVGYFMEFAKPKQLKNAIEAYNK